MTMPWEEAIETEEAAISRLKNIADDRQTDSSKSSQRDLNKRWLNFTHLFIGDGRVTCAIDHPADGSKSGLVRVGLSFCSPKDVFIKSKGRQKALGRLHCGGSMTFSFESVPGVPFKVQVMEIIANLSAEEPIPEGVRECKVSIPNWGRHRFVG